MHVNACTHGSTCATSFMCVKNITHHYHFKYFFVTFTNQNFPSIKIFAFRESTKFLLTCQARQFAYILLQKVLNYIQFSCILIVFRSQTPNGGAYSSPPYPLAVGTTHQIFVDHFWKDDSNPASMYDFRIRGKF